ncbi:MAG: hypothetical protein RR853_03680 [Aurantimicrobium sp.]|uniref:hypothetical protein n=1 Tax=Aurantimicrobium sp. TaxID=1930784 RepID=UPI002FCC9A11
MELTSQQNQKAVQRVLSVLNRFDLMGLEPGRPGGVPDDEYLPEASALVQVLAMNGAIDVDQLRHTWLEWLSDDLSGQPSDVLDDLVGALIKEFRIAIVE